ncbi:bifunctional folylpolyglutamate synthase/dihydrofolate synthase [Modestobacter roseus]|uniref:tetrahydrofolate synthase n=1 Tax=Modestobacter roseus TaxID=1181884 RepID=A0A562IPQ4_9ACTN|nr:folylpolyglutamate synthase/dihydrofolate synthase family protein [Modestobacter roseus]MQA34388.1 dihydrofolate synthase [Modestobacter roseus]TWH72715.1 dihydrofolate synthase/folylpolyglutamate synthase [Modestobacter roseus]
MTVPSPRPQSAPDVERALLRRWPESRLEPSLERMRAVMRAVGDPQDEVPVIHVTGTNGKTSTARIIDDLLRAGGLRVGRYTSPHLQSVRERIVLAGRPIDAGRFVDVHRRLEPAFGDVDGSSTTPLSFFEAITAMAFQAFAEDGLDVVVLEVGMGGAWDATNVADGRVAVVTPISLDHTEHLGPDEAAIAAEKAGIIKPGAVAVLAEQPAAAMPVLLERAASIGATVVHAGVDERVVRRTPDPDGQELDVRVQQGVHRGLRLPLLGRHQAGNTAVALVAAEAFLSSRGQQLDTGTVRAALAAVRSPGRLERVRTAPHVWVDASHNPAGMAVTAAAVRELSPPPHLIVVIAALADKDVRGMLRALRGTAAEVIVTENTSPRGMAAEDLGRLAAEELGPDRVVVERALPRALARAGERAVDHDGPAAVLVTGSVVTAGEARSLLDEGLR